MAATNSAVGTFISNVLAASGDIAQLEFAAGVSDIALVLAGTFSGTVQFEVGLSNLTTGITWVALLCNPIPSGSAASSATAVGTWQASVVGFTHFRFRCSAYASGRVYATVNGALAADGGGVITSGAAHDTAVFASATSITGVDPGTAGQVLTSNGASTDPSYQDAAGGTPGTPALSIQGASADGTTFVGIPGASFDATNGFVTLEPTAAGIPLTIQNDFGGECLDAETDDVDFAHDPVAAHFTASEVDSTGAGKTARGIISGAFLNGSNEDGNICYGVDADANSINSTGGNPQELCCVYAERITFADGFPPVIIAGVHIDNQNQDGRTASSVNTGLLIDSQSTGANVYAIKTGAGPVDFGDTVNSEGGYLAGGVAGISGSGVPTSITVVNGIITAATFA